MRLHITTRDGETFEHDVDPNHVGRLEFQDRAGDPDIPARYWLSDLLEIRVSEHPQPAASAAEPPRLKEVEIDLSPRGYLHDGSGESVRIGPKRSFRTWAVEHAPEPPPAKPKPRPKAKR